MKEKSAIVIGAGFSGLSSACFLAKAGVKVRVIEKNDISGGRARKLEADGFTFDMGPSWYWMPDVFERFFNAFGKTTADFYKLVRLDPSYRIIWGKDNFSDLPANYDEYRAMFEQMEPGSGPKLDAFLKEAEYKYTVGMSKLVYKKSSSPLEFVDKDLITAFFRLDIFNSFHKYVRKYFSDPRLIQMLEFPLLFLGGTPKTTPALYSLMNYGDIKLGTWYPEGGMYKVVEGMEKLARSLGVEFEYGSPVTGIDVEDGLAARVRVNGHAYRADVVLGTADYHHIEQHLLPQAFRNYTPAYWDKRTMSPSSLIFYLGIGKRIKNLKHHMLFFDEDFSKHASEIYEDPKWPARPSIYISNTSQTDDTVAPAGMENIMVLIPVAPGLEDTEETREKYYKYVIGKLESFTGDSIGNSVVYKRSYAHRDFIHDYNAFRGNAYGLANTLMQTAFLKPRMQSKKVKNLFYAGQLTVPGPGVPPALISGQVAAGEIIKRLQN